MPLEQAVISYDGRPDFLGDGEGLVVTACEGLPSASFILQGAACSEGVHEGEWRDLGDVDLPPVGQPSAPGLAGTSSFIPFKSGGVGSYSNTLKLAFVAGTKAALEVQGVGGSKAAARILTLPQALRATEESVPPLVPEGGMRMVLGSSKGPLDYETFVRSSEIAVARALGIHEAAVMSWNHAKEKEAVIKHLNGEVQRLGVELSKCRSEIAHLKADNLAKQDSLTAARASLTSVQVSLSTKEEALASAQASLAEIQASLLSKDEVLAGVQASLAEKEKALKGVQSSNDILRKGKEDADRQITELNAALEKKEELLTVAECSRDKYQKIVSEAAIESFRNALAQVQILYPDVVFDKVRPHYVVEGNDIVEKLPGGERRVVFQGEESDTETQT